MNCAFGMAEVVWRGPTVWGLDPIVKPSNVVAVAVATGPFVRPRVPPD